LPLQPEKEIAEKDSGHKKQNHCLPDVEIVLKKLFQNGRHSYFCIRLAMKKFSSAPIIQKTYSKPLRSIERISRSSATMVDFIGLFNRFK